MNKLFYGDNLDVMRKFIRDETVDLCYIDPPFNSKRNYNQIYNNIGTEDRAQAQAFTDTWTWDDHAIQCYEDIISNKNGVQTQQSIALVTGLEKVLSKSGTTDKGSLFAYLVSMTVRIAEIQRVLKHTGSFYLHCDKTASHYLKLVCDSIFVPQGGDYRNEITWKRTSSHSDAKRYAKISDVIYYYTKSSEYTWNPPRLPYNDDYINRYYSNRDQDGRKFTFDNLTKPKGSIGYFYDLLGVKPPPNGWRMPETRAKEWLSEGRIEIPPSGKTPRFKRYADELEGVVCSDTITDIPPINSMAKEALHYPTQKPEELIERFVETSSNEADVILDAFCGCGTSIAVAQRLKRRWIGIDITYQSISLIMKRLKKMFDEELGGSERHFDIMSAIELHGVPKDMESVDALIHKKDDRVRKEFEKWAVLTYSDNRAVINEKKGADKGIDGIAYTRKSKEEVLPVIISVKSGNIGRKEVAQLHGDVEREGAACGILITRHEPTKPMLVEAKEAGKFKPEMYQPFDRLQIVTVQEILDGARMNLPLVEEVTKKAQKAKTDVQPGLLPADG